MSQSQTSQGGSVVSFVIVGIVLVGLVIGGLYMLQQRSGGENSEEPVATKSDAPVPTPSAAPSSSSAPTATKSPAPTPAASPTPAKSPAASPAPAAHSAPVSEMPETGASDMLGSGLIAAILVGVAVSYAQSRTAHKRTVLHQ